MDPDKRPCLLWCFVLQFVGAGLDPDKRPCLFFVLSCSLSARAQFILTAVFVVSALVALVVGLTLGLQTSALENGG